MQSPQFWQYRGAIAKLLLPFSYIYYLGFKIRQSISHPNPAKIPVICVGNIVVGGAGKTPCVLAIAKILREMGKNPHIISRGYGGKIKKSTRVNFANHTAKMVGDEPLMISKYIPCWVGKNRNISIELAANAGADIVISDDGLQNPTIYKDISLLIIDGKSGLGNNYLLPSGCLRENLKSALKRTDAVIFTSKNIYNLAIDKPIINANITAKIESLDLNAKYIAFAAIARPTKFFDSLDGILRNGKIIVRYEFDDHHFFSIKELNNLINEAKQKNAILITTEKDFSRLPKNLQNGAVKYLPIEIIFTEKTNLQEILSKIFV